MIKELLRRTILKELDTESQDSWLALNFHRQMIIFLSIFIWTFFIVIYPLMPIYMVYLCEGIEISETTEFIAIIFMIANSIIFAIGCKVFKAELLNIPLLIAAKIYFLRYTLKGKAISKQDFETIKKTDENLYNLIWKQRCMAKCYAVCFHICKYLKKGHIELLAVKKYSNHVNDKEDDGKNYAIHVIYVKNGWAFDTYSVRQYPVDELYEINNAKHYKIFKYEEICNKAYDDFVLENRSKIQKWCDLNDCSNFDRNI